MHYRVWPLCFMCLFGLSAANAAAENSPPEIRIEGVDSAVMENVRAHLSLATESCDTPDWRLESLRGQAEEEISRALHAYGYYSPTITISEISKTEDCWIFAIQIEPGAPVLVGDIHINISGEAENDPAFQGLKEKPPLVSGSPLNHAGYEAAKQAISSLAMERGYLHGEFRKKELLIKPEEHRADIYLDYDSGQRYNFGKVNLNQDILESEFLERFVTIRPGDPYLSESLADLHRALADSRYFKSVEVRPHTDAAEDREIPVEVGLTPRKPQTYSLGLGASTDTGPRVSADYENRLMNRRGHRLASHLSISQVLSEITSEYKIPLVRDPLHESVEFSAGFKRERTSTDDSDIFQLGAMLNRKRGTWLESAFLDLSRETSRIGDESADATLLVPGLLWTWTETDDHVRPRHASNVRLKLQGAHEAILSDTNFLQCNASAKWITSLPWDGRVLARGDIATSLVDTFSTIPGSYRFFAGGDASVRGYTYKSLGPKGTNGEVVGGRHLLVGSMEYEQPVTSAWSLAAFVDHGNALDDFLDISGQLKTGIGMGVRWHSPIGPLRLDFAHPLDDPDNDFRFHFSMGPDL